MKQWQKNLYICAIGVFLTSAGLSQVAPILPLYFHQLGIETLKDTAIYAGLSMGITYIVVALVSPFWGKLADRKGRKIMLIRSSLGMIITNSLAALVTSPHQFILVRTLQGFVSGFYPAAITLVVSLTPKARMGQSLGLLTAMSTAGNLLGPIIGGYLSSLVGIRNMFFCIALFLLLAFLLIFFFVKEDFQPTINQSQQKLKTIWKKLPHKSLIVSIIISNFISSVAALALMPILTIYVEGLLPPGTSHVALLAGFVFSLMGLAQILTSSPFGRLADTIGPNRIVIVSMIYIGLLTIPQAYVTSIYQLLVLRFLMGLGLGGLTPAMNTFLSHYCPKEYTGQIFAYNQSAQYLGFFIGSFGGAALLSIFNFTIVFWLTGLLFIINALWLYSKIGFKENLAHE